MVEQSADEIERLLGAGEWLKSGQIAVLLDVSRSTAHRLLESGEVAYRTTTGGQRLADPDDVRRLLAKSREVRRGPSE